MGEGGAGEEGVGVELLRKGVARCWCGGDGEPAGEGDPAPAAAVAEYFLPALLPKLLLLTFSFPFDAPLQLLVLIAGEGAALVTLDPAVVGAPSK